MNLLLKILAVFLIAAKPAAAASPTYSEVRARVFAPRCNHCHDTQTRVRFPDFELTVRWLEAIERVVFVQKSMPPGPKLTDGEAALLRTWIEAGAPNDDGTPAPKPTPYPGGLEPNFESLKWHVFEAKCMSCHRHSPYDEIAPLTDYQALVDPRRGLIVLLNDGKGDPNRSPLYRAVDRSDDLQMPPKNSGVRLTPQERLTIKAWIQQGAPEKRRN